MAWPRFRNPIQKLIVPTADLGLQELDFSALEFPGDVQMVLALLAGQSAGIPRVAQLAANGQLYLRQKASVLVHPSAAETASVTSQTLDVSQYTNICLVTFISAASGTSPTVSAQLRINSDGGATYTTVAQTGNLSAAGNIGVLAAGLGTVNGFPAGPTSAVAYPAPFGTTIQWRWFIAGTTPSFTFTGIMFAE